MFSLTLQKLDKAVLVRKRLIKFFAQYGKNGIISHSLPTEQFGFQTNVCQAWTTHEISLTVFEEIHFFPTSMYVHEFNVGEKVNRIISNICTKGRKEDSQYYNGTRVEKKIIQ